jgi:hypothetical protein
MVVDAGFTILPPVPPVIAVVVDAPVKAPPPPPPVGWHHVTPSLPEATPVLPLEVPEPLPPLYVLAILTTPRIT